MFTTYKMMTSCTNEELMKRDIDSLVLEYQATDDARKRNKIIATVFCKLFPMILKIQKKFYSLTIEQKVDHVMFHLVKSLNRFDNKKMKFSSFFHMHLENQMRTLLTEENTVKRAVFQNIVSNNEERLNFYIQNKEDNSYETKASKFLADIKNSSYLSSEEKEYCTCVISGINKTKDIAKVLKLENRYSFKKPLITNPLAVQDSEEQQKKVEKMAQDRIRKIRNSIRNKQVAMGKKGINIFTD